MASLLRGGGGEGKLIIFLNILFMREIFLSLSREFSLYII